MHGRRMLLGVVCLFGLIAESLGDETYTIKWRRPQMGDSSQSENAIAAEGRIKRILVGEGDDEEELPLDLLAGNLDPKDFKFTETKNYRETVLGVEKDRVTSRRRRYEKIEEKTEEPTEHLIGKEVVIERRDNDYSFYSQDGPELLGKDAAWLRSEFDSSFDLPTSWGVPAKPVQVGEEWTFDARDFAQQFANALKERTPFEFDRDGVTATGVLARVYRRDDMLYGVMRFKIRAPLAKTTKRGEQESTKAGDRVPVNGDEASQRTKDATAKPQPDKPKAGVAEEGASELMIEITLDGPIDGSAGPWQSEHQMRLPLSVSKPVNDDFAMRIDMEMRVRGHTKTTLLP